MDKREKYSSETRIEAARLFDAGFGLKSVTTHLGLAQGTARDWVDAHRQGRLFGLAVMGNRKYSVQEKVAAVEMFLSGFSKAQVLEKFQISQRSLFTKWVAVYREFGPAGLADKPRGRPRKISGHTPETDAQRIYRLELKIAVLKKSIALLAEEDLALKTKRKSSRH